MSQIKLCRICLSTGVKLYKYDRFYLKQYYEEVMTVTMSNTNGLPHHFCYECAALLHKFHKFREKCYNGQKLLQELLLTGPITSKSIVTIDRDRKHIKSTLAITLVSRKVKTYLFKSKNRTESLVPNSDDNGKANSNEIEGIKLPKVEEIDLDYDSDDSLSNKNLAEYKNEIIEKERLKNDDVTHNTAFELQTKQMDDDNTNIDEDDDNIDDDNDNTGDDNINDDDRISCDNTSNHEEDNTEVVEIEVKDDEQKNRDIDKKNNENTKLKRFEVQSKNYLNPEHWLKINLSEEEALEEFKAREQDPKYMAAAFKCTECYKGFSKEDMLNRHKKLRHSESLGPIVCRFCSMRFKWKCLLTRHISQHYTKYKCLRCELMCPLKSTAIFHNDYHNGVTRKCVHCGEEFRYLIQTAMFYLTPPGCRVSTRASWSISRHLSTYYTHLRTHRSEHVCTLCGASFVSAIGLGIHKRTMHINTVVKPEEDVNMYCERCDIKFETRKAYEEHVFHSTKHVEGIEASTTDIPAPKKNQKRRRESFRRNPHKFTTCSICNKNFPTHTAYTKHHVAEHINIPIPSKDNERIICEICGASLAAGSVASHLNTHTRDKVFTCQVCGMQFNTKSSMTRHQLTHTGEKPYECSLCDKRFTQQSSRKLHYRTFHLKEPYPKRNRKKNTANTLDNPMIEGYHDDSEENLKMDRWR